MPQIDITLQPPIKRSENGRPTKGPVTNYSRKGGGSRRDNRAHPNNMHVGDHQDPLTTSCVHLFTLRFRAPSNRFGNTSGQYPDNIGGKDYAQSINWVFSGDDAVYQVTGEFKYSKAGNVVIVPSRPSPRRGSS